MAIVTLCAWHLRLLVWHNFSLVCCHCMHLPLVIRFTVCGVNIGRCLLSVCHLHHAVRNIPFMWVTFWVLILKNAGNMEFIGCTHIFFSVVLAATSNMLDYLPVCSVFWKNFAAIYVNFSVPWEMYRILYFSMYFRVLDGLILVFVITVGYLSLTYICDMFTLLMWKLRIV